MKKIRFGSASDNDVVFDKPGVEPHHAEVHWDGRSLTLTDLDTQTGTTINGQKVRSLPVRQGDIIGFGSYVFKLSAAHLQGLDSQGHSIPTTAQPSIKPQSSPPPSTPGGPGAESAGRNNARRTVMQSAEELAQRNGGASPGQGAARSAPQRTVLQSSTDIKAAVPGQGHTGAGSSKRTVMQSMDDIQAFAEAERAAMGFGAVALPHGAISLSIGYAPDNDVVIPVPQVSAYHARLWKGDDLLIIDDLGSNAGTLVNGERIDRALVTPQDRIELGSYRLTLSDAVLARFSNKKPGQTGMELAPRGAKTTFKVGRDDTPGVNDIVLEAPMVSNEHCELRWENNGWRVVDLDSSNGTYVNTRHKRVTESLVMPTDVLYFGTYRFPIGRLRDFLLDDQGHKAGETSLPDKPVLIVGRADECDVTIDAPQVSRRHAKLTRTPNGFTIQDLGSANGTFVNGERIKRATPIGPKDMVGLGSHNLRFDIAAGVVDNAYQGDIMLQARDVTVKVDRGRKTILHNVSFTVYPTEFVGLMGPSGAGKTTLMMALNGYLPPSNGQSLINGTDLYRNYDTYRGNIGYVPQDDIIHAELTVWEALYYTAKLRLPPDTTNQEIKKIIEDILERLEISQTRDVLIGNAARKGISGGQRKRVNLAQELITQPSLLFLDEPTSGLASEDTINVMKLLRKLADDGRTILLTIHQPSLEAYRTMDNIVYLADGHLVYYGPTYPDSITFFNPALESGTPDGDLMLSDPGNALKPLAEDKRQGRDMSERASQYLDSEYFDEYVVRRQDAGADAVSISSGAKKKASRRFGFKQWWILTMRYLTIKRKDIVNTFILFVQAPIIALIIVGVFWGRLQGTDTSGMGVVEAADVLFNRLTYAPMAIFLLVISAIWFGCSNSAREIVAEQAIYRRERMVNLKIPSYVMSKFTVLGLVCSLQCAILLLFTAPVLGFEGSLMWLYAFLVLCSLAGVGMGLLLSSLVRTPEAAIALVPLLLIPQVILGGLIVPIGEMEGPVQALTYPMLARWGYEGMLHVENESRDFIKDNDESLFKSAKRSDVKFFKVDHPLETYFDKEPAYIVYYEGGVMVADVEDKNFSKMTRLYGFRALGTVFVLLGFNLLLLLSVIIVLKIKDPAVG